MKKPIIIGVIGIIVIISMGANSFAQTDSPTLPTEKEPTQEVAESIEQVDDPLGDQVSIQMDEESIKVLDESIQNITHLLAYLVIIIAGIIAGIIIIKKRNKEDDEDSEDFEIDDDEKDLTPRSQPMAENFQEMQNDLTPDNIDDIEPEQIIENKLRIISKLQEYKIGDNYKLEEIKQLLISDGSFTQEANDYLQAKYEEYKKFKKTDSE